MDNIWNLREAPRLGVLRYLDWVADSYVVDWLTDWLIGWKNVLVWLTRRLIIRGDGWSSHDSWNLIGSYIAGSIASRGWSIRQRVQCASKKSVTDDLHQFYAARMPVMLVSHYVSLNEHGLWIAERDAVIELVQWTSLCPNSSYKQLSWTACSGWRWDACWWLAVASPGTSRPLATKNNCETTWDVPQGTVSSRTRTWPALISCICTESKDQAWVRVRRVQSGYKQLHMIELVT